jgi:hypothetical protein
VAEQLRRTGVFAVRGGDQHRPGGINLGQPPTRGRDARLVLVKG